MLERWFVARGTPEANTNLRTYRRGRLAAESAYGDRKAIDGQLEHGKALAPS
jgi:hypothetical protein